MAFAASPGPDNIAIVARSAARGPLAGVSYGVGVVMGILIGLVAASLGLAFVLSKFGWLGLSLRYVGAAYLIWSGVKLWRNADHIISSIDEPKGNRDMSGLALGFAMNLTNPKMPIFYLAVLPQSFVGHPSLAAAVAITIIIVLIEVLVIGVAVTLGYLARSADHLRAGRIARASGAMHVFKRCPAAEAKGAGGRRLGCTETPLLLEQHNQVLPTFDTTELHVRAAIEMVVSKSVRRTSDQHG